ncbi:trans-sialidase [Trypanosoma cruzi]|nr:trans-sialidase [Trypanosoma cruzi]
MARYASGKVSAGCGNREMKAFEWDYDSTSNPTGLLRYCKPHPGRLKQFLGGGSEGVRLEDGGRYVLPIQLLNGDGRSVSLTILAKGFTHDWEFSDYTAPEDCIQPAVPEWEGKGLRMMTSCGDGSRRV